MKCPECNTELHLVEIKRDINNIFRNDSLSPMTIILITTQLFTCYNCGIRVEKDTTIDYQQGV